VIQIYIPAPEEFNNVMEFKRACLPDSNTAEKFFRQADGSRFKSLGQYFHWCWAQPEANEIHAAFAAAAS
jgi:hypothetical protein